MTYRVWWHDEFKDFETAEERDRRAWTVPNTKSVLYPDGVGIPCDDVEEAAEQYADYFHSQRDGYENTWPLEFVVHDGEKFYLVEVERDFDPTFSAARPKEIQP
jgi:hypothetical protein